MDISIKDLIKNLSRQEAIKVKTRELAKQRLPDSFILRGITIQIIKQPIYEKNSIKIYIRAQKAGKELNLDNPFYFFNPPILVPSGQTQTIFDHPTNRFMEIPIYEENPQEALKENIIQTLESMLKKGKI